MGIIDLRKADFEHFTGNAQHSKGNCGMGLIQLKPYQIK